MPYLGDELDKLDLEAAIGDVKVLFELGNKSSGDR